MTVFKNEIEEYCEYPAWMFWKKRRYTVAIFAFFGFFNLYGLRVNMSIAIVAMTSLKTVELENGTLIETQEFDWNSKMQGYILSSFFYGYITTQVLGGWIANRIGGKTVFSISVGVTAFLTLLTPILAKADVYLLLTVRIVEGIFEGVTYPCMHAISARWAPPLERSRISTIAFAGSYLGTVFAMPVCAKLAKSLGWESIFYVFGVIALIWVVLWTIFISNTPQQDRYITEGELDYLNKTIPSSVHNKHIKYPLKSILLSPPVWAINCSNFSENWGFYTMLTQLPKFLKETLNFELGDAGFLSGLPYLAQGLMMPVAGFLADWLRSKEYLTTTQVRKSFNCGAFIAQTIFMTVAGYWMNPTGVVFCLVMAVGLGSFALSGYAVNHLDIAPQYASVLIGLSNTFGTMPGIISPILSGYIVTDETLQEWRAVFFITSGVYLFGCIIYGAFTSGELQPWAMEPLTNNNSETNNEKSKNTNKNVKTEK